MLDGFTQRRPACDHVLHMGHNEATSWHLYKELCSLCCKWPGAGWLVPSHSDLTKALLLIAVSEASVKPLSEGNHSHSLMVARACIAVDRQSLPLRPTHMLRTQPLVSCVANCRRAPLAAVCTAFAVGNLSNTFKTA